MVTATSGPLTQCEKHFKAAKVLLTNWRFEMWMNGYAEAVPYGPEGLLPEPVLHKLAAKCVHNLPGLCDSGWSPFSVERHGDNVLARLDVFDRAFSATKEIERQERAAKRKQEIAERNAH
ncbi:hypothetical protein SERLA73DRAFT_70380 [Serpula lacrymans var. lacrymans S7.3]|uniref:Uncharacterized protein n=2 Tax=Serpula lacrymans var. lacrymans TaxID=341189 RepID=F8PMQ8_SERL3|nr:uncharacterized protein SERLADRAFT_434504 [Serpula lacrymans var. lacrymans S7.9]EGO02890.1 hypothetical protein SERLA73DRAFT_70380 [Serpula lacrymans var. lacrymans S7.3]EGO28581.1 hypothetical protein SERLADRAFT_434504 [Serpula lacrymans var. lacrymans S7.9]